MAFTNEPKNSSSFSNEAKNTSVFKRFFRHGKDPSGLELGDYSSLDTISFLDKDIIFGDITENDLADIIFTNETKN